MDMRVEGPDGSLDQGMEGGQASTGRSRVASPAMPTVHSTVQVAAHGRISAVSGDSTTLQALDGIYVHAEA